MQVIRQKTERHQLERPIPLNTSPGTPQADPRKIIYKKRPALICHHREEVITTAKSRASVIRHVTLSDKSNNGFSAWATSCPSYLASLCERRISSIGGSIPAAFDSGIRICESVMASVSAQEPTNNSEPGQPGCHIVCELIAEVTFLDNNPRVFQRRNAARRNGWR